MGPGFCRGAQRSGLDGAVGAEAPGTAERARIVAVGQRRDRLPVVGAKAGGDGGIMAERQEDTAFGDIFGAQPVVDQRSG